MTIEFNANRLRHLIRGFDFHRLFLEELGWDANHGTLEIRLDGQVFSLSAVAQKRGMAVYRYPAPPGERIPEYPKRRKIEKQVAKHAHEHIIIFTDPENSIQIWQWVKREPGRPAACREHTYHQSQPGDALIQKLSAIAFSLDEEETLTLTDVTCRVRAGLDVERVTKRFFDRFKKEHAAFLRFITGISEIADRDWYASVMLNRLMFVYFIQRKGFLNGDRDYLRDRLAMTRKEYGQDKFYSFYRYFLLRLFHEGLGGRKRTPALEKLIGKIPYLNGGLFEIHPIEQRYPDIQIPDKAFESIFSYFDEYHWHLDERPLRADNEINPDVLGYIFEKYINQKQMGAYYTREDITEYIAKNTIIPSLFDAARAKCRVAFDNPGGPTLWDLLKIDPDRYIYSAVGHGADIPLPPEIAEGIDIAKPNLLERRKGWNMPAPPDVALPTEIWREVITRRQRCEEIHCELGSGKVSEINDLITLNLDIRQFAQDAIENCEGPELLRAFWHAIERVTVLDPTCGSGAFLFAALNILEPLYEACLNRMEAFLEDMDRSGQSHHREKLSDFRAVLERLSAHPNPRYFIFKGIILNNLFGVDIMEEAVEICKLRLFLKLAAQVEPDATKENFGIEPLPDVDFNIRAGNSLVGYATADEVRRVFREKPSGKRTQYNLMFGDKQDAYDRFDDQLQIADKAFHLFRDMQTQQGMETKDFVEAKHALKDRLIVLDDELNRSLAREYGMELSASSGKKTKTDSVAYKKWLKSHQPFHWFIEFYGIMQSGGFDVIIGNPPYVELNTLKGYRLHNYSCQDSGNLYALILERCESIAHRESRQGFIVPVSSISTDRYSTLQQLLVNREIYFSSYDDRPSRLFDGLEHIRLTIHILGRRARQPLLWSTRYNKWMSEERPVLFEKLNFSNTLPVLIDNVFPKLSSEIEQAIIQKLSSQKHRLAAFYSGAGQHHVFYSRKVGYFLQVLDFEPKVFDGNGQLRPPSEFKELKFMSDEHAKVSMCCLNSNLFYWFVTVFSDCRHVNKREIDGFPIDLKTFSTSDYTEQLLPIAYLLMNDLKKNSEMRKMRFQHDTLTVQCIYPKVSKPIIDAIDMVLAKHYKFTDEELDFIVNYDIKYRMGRDGGNVQE